MADVIGRTYADCLLEHLECLAVDRETHAAASALKFVRNSDPSDKAEAEKQIARAETFRAARKIVSDYLPGIIQQAKGSKS